MPLPQETLLAEGFTEFKTRSSGRFDLNPPALQHDPALAFLTAPDAAWMGILRALELLGPDMKLIAMGCMLSMPGAPPPRPERALAPATATAHCFWLR